MIQISVCLSAYNGEAFISEQLLSILQSPLVDEVLVSDDGSSDRTREIVQGQQDPRLRLLNGPGRGLSRNVEYLLEHAKGRFIFLADQDDVWLPAKVPVMLEALRRGNDVVLSDCMVVDRSLRPLHSSYFALIRSRPGLLRNVFKNSYLGCCMAMRREILASALPFPNRPPAHDWWIGLIAELRGTVAFIDVPLLQYRRHGNNVSSASGQSTVPIAQRLTSRMQLVRCLISRWWVLACRHEHNLR